MAGVNTLQEFVDAFKVPKLYYSSAGVREGIIADLAHRKVGLEQTKLDPAPGGWTQINDASTPAWTEVVT